MSGDRLSRLPDPVLWQVLSHAPAKEAVCTGALARSWRSLWLSSGVLNLDSRSYGSSGKMRYSRSLVFIRDANAALLVIADATDEEGIKLKKLTFTYLAPENDEDAYWSRRHIDDGLDALLTGAPAARGVEELRVHVSPSDDYSLGVAALPSAALRVLHLDGLELKPFPHAHSPSFTRLETLRLRRCDVRLTDLQAIVDASPLLTTLELSEVSLLSGGQQWLRCPRVTTLSLASLGGLWCGVELEATSLRHFAYRESLQPFTLVSPPASTSMVRADLHFELDFFPACSAGGRQKKAEARRLLWSFVSGFSEADILKVSFEQPGGRRRAEQMKELNLQMTKGTTVLRRL